MIYDPLDTAAQQAAEAEATERAKIKAGNLADDFRWLMSNRRGRRLAWWLLDKAGVHRSSFTGNSNSTFFNEGMRNVGLALMAQILEVCPQQYTLMLDEARKHDRHTDDRRHD